MSEMGNWYQSLVKPSWSPPAWLFGPVWTFLYILIIVSFGKVFQSFFKKEISFLILLPFVLNIIFNLIFTPLQFGLRSNLLAAIDIILVLITLIWAMIAIYPTFKWVTYMQIPYLMWVSIASVLQISILLLNS
jgi:tryptophan-rich sensory protein